MKTLEIIWDAKKNRATVQCPEGPVSVHRNCAFCMHCKGVWIGKKLYHGSPGDSDEILLIERVE